MMFLFTVYRFAPSFSYLFLWFIGSKMIPKIFVLLMEQCVSHCVYASVRFALFSFLLSQAQLLFLLFLSYFMGWLVFLFLIL
ncbi:hypothetical protein DFP73DRAFT_564023 [Morchella snyderi]|nr:hypothetical protein DFP73DRAFT_564023 [Morchella snyderi]